MNFNESDINKLKQPGPGRLMAAPTQAPQQNIINMLNDMQLIALLSVNILAAGGAAKPMLLYNPTAPEGERLKSEPDTQFNPVKSAVTQAENILLEVVGRDMAHSTAHQQVRIGGCFRCAFVALKEHYDTAMQINNAAREKAMKGE